MVRTLEFKDLREKFPTMTQPVFMAVCADGSALVITKTDEDFDEGYCYRIEHIVTPQHPVLIGEGYFDSFDSPDNLSVVGFCESYAQATCSTARGRHA